jgi:NADH dehydrogenase [ubiquinone] 1 alpha subcomplex assembly factor 1
MALTPRSVRPACRRGWRGPVLAAFAVTILGAPHAGIGAPPSSDKGETTVTASEVISITEFDPADGGQWRAVDDVVMGGVSASGMRLTEAGVGVFEGELSLANNGGFASVRRAVGPLDLSDYGGIALRVRGDGQRYRLRLRTDDRYDGVAWQASFVAAESWRVVELDFDAFQPSFRGRRPPGAGPLDVSGIRQLGLMIADRQAGPFRLEIDWIRALPDDQGGGDVPPAATRISLD